METHRDLLTHRPAAERRDVLKAGIDGLTKLGRELGFDVIGKSLVELGDQPVSSSRIRRCLSNGDVTTAREMLGRYHEVSGIVKVDRQLGARMGFPTINLRDVTVMYPKSGIYAAICDLANAMENDGSMPMTSPVDRISGPSTASVPANLLKGKTDSLTDVCSGLVNSVTPKPSNDFPIIALAAT